MAFAIKMVKSVRSAGPLGKLIQKRQANSNPFTQRILYKVYEIKENEFPSHPAGWLFGCALVALKCTRQWLFDSASMALIKPCTQNGPASHNKVLAKQKARDIIVRYKNTHICPFLLVQQCKVHRAGRWRKKPGGQYGSNFNETALRSRCSLRSSD